MKVTGQTQQEVDDFSTDGMKVGLECYRCGSPIEGRWWDKSCRQIKQRIQTRCKREVGRMPRLKYLTELRQILHHPAKLLGKKDSWTKWRVRRCWIIPPSPERPHFRCTSPYPHRLKLPHAAVDDGVIWRLTMAMHLTSLVLHGQMICCVCYKEGEGLPTAEMSDDESI